MSYKPVQVRPEMDFLTLMYVLQSNHLTLVPVVDHAGRLTGIAAPRDVLRGYLNSTSLPQASPSDDDSQDVHLRRAG